MSIRHPARQRILYIADACHSGFIQSHRCIRPVRVSMTAGTADPSDEDFNNHGLSPVLPRHSGEADLIADQQITTTELQPTFAKVRNICFNKRPNAAKSGRSPFLWTRPVHHRRNPKVQRRLPSYVWKHGVMDGIIPLTEAQIKERPFPDLSS